MTAAATTLDARNAPAMQAAVAAVPNAFTAYLLSMPPEEKRKTAARFESLYVVRKRNGVQP